MPPPSCLSRMTRRVARWRGGRLPMKEALFLVGDMVAIWDRKNDRIMRNPTMMRQSVPGQSGWGLVDRGAAGEQGERE